MLSNVGNVPALLNGIHPLLCITCYLLHNTMKTFIGLVTLIIMITLG